MIVLQDVLKKFGQMVRIARAKKGYTQVELAEKLHTTDRTVSKIECGQMNPSLDTVVDYARELVLSLDEIVREATAEKVPYCAERFFAGMDEVQARKYIKLCEAADFLHSK